MLRQVKKVVATGKKVVATGKMVVVTGKMICEGNVLHRPIVQEHSPDILE